MEEHTALVSTKNDFKNFLVRLGKIFSNMSILFLIISICGLFSFVSLAFVFLTGAVIIVITVGTIFIINPNFGSLFMSAVDVSSKVSIFFLENFYIFAGVTLATAVVSLVLLVLDRRTKHTARIVTSSIVIGIAVILTIFAAGVII